MLFKIHSDIDIRARHFTSSVYGPNARTQPVVFKNYNYQDLARDVSFCLEYINSIPDDKPIGIFYGQLTYYHIAFKLALVKSQRPYILFQSDDTEAIRTDLDKYCSRIFVLGEWDNKWFVRRKLELIASDRYKFDDFIVDTDTWEFQNLAESHLKFDNLEFEFSDNQKVYYLQATIGKTDDPKLAYTSGHIEASSIATAMKYYVEEDDVCVHHRPFKHFGVGTLIIYPALFKARRHIICTTQFDWSTEHQAGTNIHMAYQMITAKFSLPKSTRIVTTGGYNFDQNCIKYVLDRCSPEKIIDCFGLSVCPPPLAIRTLTADSQKVPFEWVNDFLKFEINSSNNLEIIGRDNIFKDVSFSIDHNKLKIGDHVLPAGPNQFYFLGQSALKVRVNHQLIDKEEFSNMVINHLAQGKLPTHIKLNFENKNGVPFPVLAISVKAYDYIKKYVEDHAAEVQLAVLES